MMEVLSGVILRPLEQYEFCEKVTFCLSIKKSRTIDQTIEHSRKYRITVALVHRSITLILQQFLAPE